MIIDKIIKSIEADLEEKGSVDNYCFLFNTNSHGNFSKLDDDFSEQGIEAFQIVKGYPINHVLLAIKRKLSDNKNIDMVVTIESENNKKKLDSIYDLLISKTENLANHVFITVEKKDKVEYYKCSINKDNKVTIQETICNLKKKFFNYYN